MKANNAKISCQLLLLFCFALKGLVCKLAVEHQMRYTKRVDLPTDVAVQVVSVVLRDVVHPWWGKATITNITNSRAPDKQGRVLVA